MATWTAMTDLATGDLVTEADMDAIRGNIEYLLDPNRDQAAHNNSADYTTTSGSYGDVDGTNLSLSVTTNGGPLFLYAMFSINFGAVSTSGVRITVDGTAALQLDYDAIQGNQPLAISGYYDVAAGAHTINLQYKSNGATTITIYSNGQSVLLGAMEV